MDYVNTNEHRISVTVDGTEHVKRPGQFDASGDVGKAFAKVPGVFEADSDEGRAYLDAHPVEDPTATGDGTQIARRERVAGFGADERVEMALENRRMIGDDAAPGGAAAGVNTPRGDRPISPALQTTEDEADLLRHGIDVSDEPGTGPIGPSGETLADRTPGSAPGPAEAAMADARVAGDGTLTTTKVPTRSGVRGQRAKQPEAPAGDGQGEGDGEPGELKGEALEAAVKAHNESAADDAKIPSNATADEQRAALAKAAS